jgi:excisionase family DNA binding protein
VSTPTVEEAAAQLVAALVAETRRALPRPDPVEREYISIKEAGALLGMSRNGIVGLINRGELPTHKVGRRRLLKRTSIERLVADR